MILKNIFSDIPTVATRKNSANCVAGGSENLKLFTLTMKYQYSTFFCGILILIRFPTIKSHKDSLTDAVVNIFRLVQGYSKLIIF